MLVDGAVAKIAAAGHWNKRLMEPSQKGAQEITGCTHGPCKFVGNGRIGDTCGIYLYGVSVQKLHLCAHFFKDLQALGYIAYFRHVFKDAWLVAKDSCSNKRNSGIFCTANIHVTMKRLPASDNKFLQNKHNSSKQANSQISLSFYASYYTTVRLKIKALTENFHDLFNFFFCGRKFS